MIIEYLEFYHKNLSNSYKSIRDTLGKIMSNLINLEWFPTLSTVDEVISNPECLIPGNNVEIKRIMMHIVSELENYRLQNNVTKYQNMAKTGILIYIINVKFWPILSTIYSPIKSLGLLIF